MVTLQILVLPFLVRVQVGQHDETSAMKRRFSFSLRPLLPAPPFRERHRSAAGRPPFFHKTLKRTGMPPTGTGRQPSEYLSHVPSRPPLPRRAKKGGRPQRGLPPLPVLPPLSATTGTGLAAAGNVLPQGNGGRKESTQKTVTSPRPQGERFAATAAGLDLRNLPFRGRYNAAFASESLTEPHRARTYRTD